MTEVKVQMARCWSCMLGQCYDPPQPHTWMDSEDAEAGDVPWPLSQEDRVRHPCACWCAGGDGPCRTMDSADLPEPLRRIVEGRQ